MEDLPRELVNANPGRITNSDVGELGLFVVCLHPPYALDEGDDLRPGRHQLTGANLPFPHAPIARRIDLRVAEIYLSDHQTCFFGVKIGGKLLFLRLEDSLLTPFRFNSQLTAAQPGFGLGQIGVAAGELSGELLFVSNSSFEFLLSCCVSLTEALLSLSLRASPNQLSFNRVLAGLRCRNLGLRLIDS